MVVPGLVFYLLYDSGEVQLTAEGRQSIVSLAVPGLSLVLYEVLDEAASRSFAFSSHWEVLSIGAMWTRIAIHAGQLREPLKSGRNLGGSLVDGTAQDGVDDAAGILMEMRLPVPFQPVFTR